MQFKERKSCTRESSLVSVSVSANASGIFDGFDRVPGVGETHLPPASPPRDLPNAIH